MKQFVRVNTVYVITLLISVLLFAVAPQAVQADSVGTSLDPIVLSEDQGSTEVVVPGAAGTAKTSMKADIGVDHVDVGLYTYYSKSSTDDIEIIPIEYDNNNSGVYHHTLNFTDYIRKGSRQGNSGLMLYFVKPSQDDYLLTSQYVSGKDGKKSMNFFPIDGPYGNNNNALDKKYPHFAEICAQAKSQGYQYVFGYARWDGFEGDISAELVAQKVGLDVTATCDYTGKDRKVGDTLNFTVTMKPTEVVGNDLSYNFLMEDGDTYAMIGDDEYYFDKEEWTENEDGSVTATLPYVITQADVTHGNVTFAVHGGLKYEFSMETRGIRASSRVTTDDDYVVVDIEQAVADVVEPEDEPDTPEEHTEDLVVDHDASKKAHDSAQTTSTKMVASHDAVSESDETIVDTGDTSNGIYVVLFALAAAGLGILMVAKKRRA